MTLSASTDEKNKTNPQAYRHPHVLRFPRVLQSHQPGHHFVSVTVLSFAFDPFLMQWLHDERGERTNYSTCHTSRPLATCQQVCPCAAAAGTSGWLRTVLLFSCQPHKTKLGPFATVSPTRKVPISYLILLRFTISAGAPDQLSQGPHLGICPPNESPKGSLDPRSGSWNTRTRVEYSNEDWAFRVSLSTSTTL